MCHKDSVHNNAFYFQEKHSLSFPLYLFISTGHFNINTRWQVIIILQICAMSRVLKTHFIINVPITQYDLNESKFHKFHLPQVICSQSMFNFKPKHKAEQFENSVQILKLFFWPIHEESNVSI